MSAFVCSQLHFERVNSSLEHFWSKNQDKPGAFNHLFYDLDDLNQTVMIWERLNIETVAHKYAHGDKKKAHELIKEYLEEVEDFEPAKKLNKIAMYKAICCIRYQIEAEHLDRDLTSLEATAIDRLDRLCTNLPKDIVHATEQYQKADWAID